MFEKAREYAKENTGKVVVVVAVVVVLVAAATVAFGS